VVVLVSLFRSKGVSFFPRGSSSLFSAQLWVRVKDSLDPVSLARLWGGASLGKAKEKRKKERKTFFLSFLCLEPLLSSNLSLSLEFFLQKKGRDADNTERTSEEKKAENREVKPG